MRHSRQTQQGHSTSDPGNVGFVEVKRNGGKLDAMQQEWISRLSPHAPTFVLIAASTPTLVSAQIDHILDQFAGWLPR